jgi:F-type H+-transporting ATPase subunit b
MRAQIVKIVLPILLALALCTAPSLFASGHGGVGDDALIQSVEASIDEHKAAVDLEHGDVAAAHHEQALAAEHNAKAEEGMHSAEHEGGAHHGPMITAEKLKDLFWRTVNFIALLVILIKFLAKPISSGLTGRKQQIKEELAELQSKRDEAERSYKEFESRLAGMEKEMDTIVEKAIAQAGKEKDRILAEAERGAEDIKRQAEAAVKAELVDAKRTLRNEVADTAAAMAEELIVKNLTADDQDAITEQYLESVGAVP